MERYLELSDEDRRLACTQEEELGLLNAAAVEKDFWVCWTLRAFDVRTLAPERTFWEKVMLLHEQTYGAEVDDKVKRLSRHYYDVWCLWNKGDGKDALKDTELFEHTFAHRTLYFARKAAAQAAIRKGCLSLLPNDAAMQNWINEYRAMREMFFSEPPDFDDLLATTKEIQESFNTQ